MPIEVATNIRNAVSRYLEAQSSLKMAQYRMNVARDEMTKFLGPLSEDKIDKVAQVLAEPVAKTPSKVPSLIRDHAEAALAEGRFDARSKEGRLLKEFVTTKRDGRTIRVRAMAVEIAKILGLPPPKKPGPKPNTVPTRSSGAVALKPSKDRLVEALRQTEPQWKRSRDVFNFLVLKRDPWALKGWTSAKCHWLSVQLKAIPGVLVSKGPVNGAVAPILFSYTSHRQNPLVEQDDLGELDVYSQLVCQSDCDVNHGDDYAAESSRINRSNRVLTLELRGTSLNSEKPQAMSRIQRSPTTTLRVDPM